MFIANLNDPSIILYTHTHTPYFRITRDPDGGITEVPVSTTARAHRHHHGDSSGSVSSSSSGSNNKVSWCLENQSQCSAVNKFICSPATELTPRRTHIIEMRGWRKRDNGVVVMMINRM